MINNRKVRRSKGFQKMGMMALSLTLALSLGVSGIAATTSSNETREQIHTVQEDIRTKIDELNELELTDAQKAELENLETQLKEMHGGKRSEFKVVGLRAVGFFGVELTDEQKEAIKDMSYEEQIAYLEANMTEEQKADYEKAKADMEARQAEWDSLSDEEKEAKMKEARAEMEALQAEWDSLSDEEKEAKMKEAGADNLEYAINATSSAVAVSSADGTVTITQVAETIPALPLGVAAPAKGGRTAMRMNLTEEQIEATKNMSEEEKKAYLEANMTEEQKAAMEENKVYGGKMVSLISFTEEQIEAMKDMSAEEKKAYLEANMTEEQKEAYETAKAEMEAKRAEMEANMTDEQKAEMEEKLAEQLAKYQEILTALNAIA